MYSIKAIKVPETPPQCMYGSAEWELSALGQYSDYKVESFSFKLETNLHQHIHMQYQYDND